MPPLFYQIAIGLGVFIAILLPFAALLGFFEDRKNGAYRFRSWRFLSMAGFIFIYSLGIYFLELKCSEAKIIVSEEKIEARVEKSRAFELYSQNNLSAVLPAVINDRNMPCYMAAISNYIEDRWRKIYRAESCQSVPHICADDEQSLFNAFRHEKNTHHYPLFDNVAAYTAIENMQSTARDMYKLLRSFNGIMNPAGVGQPDIGTDRQAFDAFEAYFANCASLKPLPWITPDAPLVQFSPAFCLGDCP